MAQNLSRKTYNSSRVLLLAFHSGKASFSQGALSGQNWPMAQIYRSVLAVSCQLITPFVLHNFLLPGAGNRDPYERTSP